MMFSKIFHLLLLAVATNGMLRRTSATLKAEQERLTALRYQPATAGKQASNVEGDQLCPGEHKLEEVVNPYAKTFATMDKQKLQHGSFKGAGFTCGICDTQFHGEDSLPVEKRQTPACYNCKKCKWECCLDCFKQEADLTDWDKDPIVNEVASASTCFSCHDSGTNEPLRNATPVYTNIKKGIFGKKKEAKTVDPSKNQFEEEDAKRNWDCAGCGKELISAPNKKDHSMWGCMECQDYTCEVCKEDFWLRRARAAAKKGDPEAIQAKESAPAVQRKASVGDLMKTLNPALAGAAASAKIGGPPHRLGRKGSKHKLGRKASGRKLSRPGSRSPEDQERGFDLDVEIEATSQPAAPPTPPEDNATKINRLLREVKAEEDKNDRLRTLAGRPPSVDPAERQQMLDGYILQVYQPMAVESQARATTAREQLATKEFQRKRAEERAESTERTAVELRQKQAKLLGVADDQSQLMEALGAKVDEMKRKRGEIAEDARDAESYAALLVAEARIEAQNRLGDSVRRMDAEQETADAIRKREHQMAAEEQERKKTRLHDAFKEAAAGIIIGDTPTQALAKTMEYNRAVAYEKRALQQTLDFFDPMKDDCEGYDFLTYPNKIEDATTETTTARIETTELQAALKGMALKALGKVFTGGMAELGDKAASAAPLVIKVVDKMFNLKELKKKGLHSLFKGGRSKSEHSSESVYYQEPEEFAMHTADLIAELKLEIASHEGLSVEEDLLKAKLGEDLLSVEDLKNLKTSRVQKGETIAELKETLARMVAMQKYGVLIKHSYTNLDFKVRVSGIQRHKREAKVTAIGVFPQDKPTAEWLRELKKEHNAKYFAGLGDFSDIMDKQRIEAGNMARDAKEALLRPADGEKMLLTGTGVSAMDGLTCEVEEANENGSCSVKLDGMGKQPSGPGDGCPRKHKLKQHAVEKDGTDWNCDVCGEISKYGESMAMCMECDWGLCAACEVAYPASTTLKTIKKAIGESSSDCTLSFGKGVPAVCTVAAASLKPYTGYSVGYWIEVRCTKCEEFAPAQIRRLPTPGSGLTGFDVKMLDGRLVRHGQPRGTWRERTAGAARGTTWTEKRELEYFCTRFDCAQCDERTCGCGRASRATQRERLAREAKLARQAQGIKDAKAMLQPLPKPTIMNANWDDFMGTWIWEREEVNGKTTSKATDSDNPQPWGLERKIQIIGNPSISKIHGSSFDIDRARLVDDEKETHHYLFLDSRRREELRREERRREEPCVVVYLNVRTHNVDIPKGLHISPTELERARERVLLLVLYDYQRMAVVLPPVYHGVTTREFFIKKGAPKYLNTKEGLGNIARKFKIPMSQLLE